MYTKIIGKFGNIQYISHPTNNTSTIVQLCNDLDLTVITVGLVINNKLTTKLHQNTHTSTYYKKQVIYSKCRIQKGQGSLNIIYKNDIKVHSSMRCKEI